MFFRWHNVKTSVVILLSSDCGGGAFGFGMMPTFTQLHLLFSQESKSDGESNSLPLQVSHTNYILELLCRMLLHDTSVQSDQL